MQRKHIANDKHFLNEVKFMKMEILKRKSSTFLSVCSRYSLQSFCFSFDSAQDDKAKRISTTIGAI